MAEGFAKAMPDKELAAAKRRDEFTTEKKLDSVRYEQAAEANGYDWPKFRQSTIDKLLKGVKEPYAADFKLFDDWLRATHKGPIESMLLDRTI